MLKRNRLFILPWLLQIVAQAASAVSVITYTVKPLPETKQFEITLDVPRIHGDSLRVQIPTWSPGAYIVAGFASSIMDVTAQSKDGKALDVTHPDKQTWEVSTHGVTEARIRYHVNNSDLVMVDGKPKRAHLSGPRSYFYVVGRKNERVEALVIMADAGWKVATSLDGDDTPRLGPAGATYHFRAPNYDVLADAPIEMGDFAEDTFEVRGVPHRIVLYGDYAHVDRAKLTEYCKRIAEEEIRFFNDAPMKRYVFMFRVGGPIGRGAGGLEHLGSTEIGFSGPVDDRTRSVIAHEYFHLWNVKRIRPEVLGPFDYIDPPHTKNLWWSEGVTSYYGDLLSRRAGINTDDEYLKHLADTITLLQNNPARLRVTADDSSYNVWNGGGSQGFGNLSYYTKGELIGLCMDLRIRHETRNRRSLDDVIRDLYRLCDKGRGPGFGEDEIRAAVSRVAGKDLSAFYDALVRSTADMPFAECLAFAGLTIAQAEKPTVSSDSGMFLRPDLKGMRIRGVRPGGAAETAGFMTGDLLTALDGDPKALAGLQAVKPGATVRLTFERDGKEMEKRFTMGSVERRPFSIAVIPTATPESTRLRDSWLNH